MSEKNPFEDLKNKKLKLGIELEGKPIEVFPEVGDAEMFMLFKGTTKEDIQNMTKIITEMLVRSYPEADIDSINSFVAMNYAKLFEEIAILYGFVTRPGLDDIKKKAIETKQEN